MAAALRPYNDPEYRAAKQHLRRTHVECHFGCGHRATTPDHVPAIMEHHHVRGTRCCQLLPACHSCNSSHGATIGNRLREPHSEQWTPPPTTDPDRRVILICGPPGAGKTTHAHTLGLPVYDIDDVQWSGDEKRFRPALAQLARTPAAQAVVIRSGATISARNTAAEQIGATETLIILTDRDECMRRVRERNRPRPSLDRQLAAVAQWWKQYQPDRLAVTASVTEHHSERW